MLFIILNVILSTGTWQVEEYAVAKNITLAPTIDNRIKFNTILFTDNKECDVYNKKEQYTFNTEADAMQYWAANIESTSVARYEERRHITTNTCSALQKNNSRFITILILFLVVGTAIDLLSIYMLCRRYKHRIQQTPQGNQRQSRLILPQYHPLQQRGSDIQPLPKSEGLSVYAAQLIAESYIHRREICPITQEPLDKVSLLVPECGHVISESSGYTSNTCCVCKKNVNYTRVEGKLTIVKSTQMNDAVCVNV